MTDLPPIPQDDSGAPQPPAPKPAAAPAPDRAERARRQSQLLDEGLEETFPASDPVSIAQVE